MRTNILLTLEYDGTAYCGWQAQPSGGSVQQRLEKALSELFQAPVSCIGCSRTDAGVHALNYCVNFVADTRIPIENIPLALLPFLPPDISVKRAEAVPDDFHAQYRARSKTYRYWFYTSPTPSPLLRCRAWHIQRPLQLTAMQEAASFFLGEHDFDAFCAAGGTAKTTRRTILHTELQLLHQRDCFSLYQFEIRGTGFLYNMVRIITGTLAAAGQGKLPPDRIPEILRSGDRTKAGMTAPAHGLYLAQVYY